MDNKLTLTVQFAALDQLSGALRSIAGLGRTGSSALRALQGDARQLKRDMREASAAIASSSGNVTQLIDRERSLAAQLARTNRLIEQQKRLMAIDARADAIQQRGQDLQGRGRDNLVAGASLAAPLFLAARAGADYSTALVDIQQKADLTNTATDRLGRTMLQIAADTRQLPQNVAATVDTLAGMGLEANKAVQIAPAIARLGTAYRVDLADGASAAYANINNLKVPLSETARALDIMATSGKLGAFEVRDMARSFPSLTGQLNALGESGLSAVGRLSAALQIARQTTGSSDEAANNIQNLLTKINAPGTIRAFEKNFGVNLPAAIARLRAQGYDTFEAIAMITRDATGGDLSKLGFAFEDMQAQAGIRTLIQNLDEYRRVRNAAMAGEGTVNRAFDQRVLRDANVSWQAFMGSVSTLAITLGTTLLPTLTEVANSLNAGLQWVSRWAQANPEAAGAIMKTVGALAAMRIGLGAAQMAFGAILGPVGTVFRVFGKARELGIFSRILGTVVNGAIRAAPLFLRAFGIMRVAVLFLARGVMQAGLMLLANPVILAITLIVVAIAGAGYLIWRHWDTIKAAFGRGIAALGQAWQWIRANFARLLPMFGPLGMAASLVINNWGRIKAAFFSGLNVIRGLIGQFTYIGRQIIEGLIGGIAVNPGRVWNALRNIVMAGIRNIRSLLGIASPSRLFMAMGGFMTEGLAIGLDDGARQPLRSVQRLAAGVASGMAVAASPFAAGAAVAGAAAAAAPSAAAPGPVTINVYQLPGEDSEQLARRIAEIMRRGPKPGEGGGSYGDG